MAWIPAVKIDGGLYGGRTYPDGDLSGFFSYMENVQTSLHGILGVKQSGTSTAWSGKFGLQSDLVTQYWRDHLDGQLHEFILAEIVVENPEGAQYYKQSIVYTCRTKANAAVHRTKTIEGVVYEADTSDVEFGIINVKRYEYATPYSTPTATQLVSAFRGFSARYKLSGDDEALSGNNILYSGNDFIIPIGFGSYDGKLYHICGDYVNMAYTHGALEGLSVEYWNEQWGPVEIEVPKDPNDEDPPEDGPGRGGGGGGEGDHVLPDGPILVPPIPGLGSCSPSWLKTYMMDLDDLNEFGTELVDPTPMQQLKAYFSDPLDAIVGITLCPCVPEGPRTGFTPVIHGTPGYEFSRAYTVIHSQYGIVDCGFVDMAPYWDNCFDFDPYTKISIFLPFIGFREINADEVMGGKIGVVYHVDVVTGDCIAFITISAPSGSIYGPMQEKVIGEHHGNCGIQVPIGRVSHDAAVSASLNLMTTFAGMAVGAAAGYAGLAAPQEISESQVASQLSSSTMTAVEGMKTKVERAGALGGNAGYMGNRKPYLIRQIPRQSKPDNYKQICGYPCNKPGPLSNFETGTLACVEDIQLNNIPAMETEREEIIQFLRGGVIL